MSLILEALKKVEREKQARDTGLVVVGATPWSSARRPWWPMAAALAGTAALGAAVAALMLRPSPAPAAVSRPAASSIAPTATTAAEAPSPLAAAPPALAVPPALSLPLPEKAEAVRVAPLRRPVAATAAAPRPASAAPPSTADAPEPAPRAPVVRDPAGPALRLQAISEQDGQPVAMLNDRLVREGEVVDGARVVHIGADSVEVEVSGRKLVLRF